ncbi:MAG: cupin domain-containing protein [Anaerolineae bacterium]|nr:MAG: cupin domain-containing protein [Anaerolineae bacterium]
MNEQTPPNVGRHLRALRHERGLSLRALAELCELSPNTISLIERGATSPTVSTLHRLATALGVPITSLFAGPAEKVKAILTRADERPASGSASVVLESLGYGLEEQACDPFVVNMKAGAGSGRQVMTHTGHELVYCLRGQLDYEVAGEHYRLAPGDALLFHADLPHRWHNSSDHPAVFLLVMQIVEEREEPLNQHLHP